MKHSFNTKLYGWFYHSSCTKECKRKKLYGAKEYKAIEQEYISIIGHSKEIGSSRMMSAYCMGAYFIALNRILGGNPQDNYTIFRDGLSANKLFRKALGNADAYLSSDKMPGRKEWERESHLKKYENDWVVDVLEGNNEYDLGYNYYECGICKLCKDENCFELAKYICQLDYLLAEMMGMELKRTMTIAEGGAYCDFRYSKGKEQL